MPKCVCLITCQGAVLDQASQNWTLFNTVEQVSTPFLGVPHPLETVTFWHVLESEVGKKFRLKLILETEDGKLAAQSEEADLVPGSKRHRVRIVGLPFPDSAGKYVAKVEWRPLESSTWQKEPAEWRLEINAAPMPFDIIKPAIVTPKT
jgi:hypothetical protein